MVYFYSSQFASDAIPGDNEGGGGAISTDQTVLL